MINVIKEAENGKADLDAYTKKVIFELFPVIGTSVFLCRGGSFRRLVTGGSFLGLDFLIISIIWALFNRLL